MSSQPVPSLAGFLGPDISIEEKDYPAPALTVIESLSDRLLFAVPKSMHTPLPLLLPLHHAPPKFFRCTPLLRRETANQNL